MALTIKNETNKSEIACLYALEECFCFFGSHLYASYYGLDVKVVLIKDFFSADF